MLSVKSLYLSGNKISAIDPVTIENLPNLETIILTDNLIADFSHLECLSKLKNLAELSLINNPITVKKMYRYFVIHRIPSLKYLDLKKIKPTEREEANKIFTSAKFKQIVGSISSLKNKTMQISNKVNTFTPGEDSKIKISKEEMQKLKKEIENAKSFAAIEKINEKIRKKKLEAN